MFFNKIWILCSGYLDWVPGVKGLPDNFELFLGNPFWWPKSGLKKTIRISLDGWGIVFAEFFISELDRHVVLQSCFRYVDQLANWFCPPILIVGGCPFSSCTSAYLHCIYLNYNHIKRLFRSFKIESLDLPRSKFRNLSSSAESFAVGSVSYFKLSWVFVK